MATFAILRTCSRGGRYRPLDYYYHRKTTRKRLQEHRRLEGTRCLLVKMQQQSGALSLETTSKIFSTSSASNGALDYFRARRGPFTPEEKRGSGHMMTASTHWKVERFVAVSMVAIMPAALFYQGPIMDHLFTTFVYLHGHWGMKGVLTDYLVKFVPWIQYVWYTVSILGFAGMIHFNFNDVGFTKAIQMLWSI